MRKYWKRITDVVDFNVSLGNKIRKLRQYDLLRLADIPEEQRDSVIKEYLKCYTQDRYQNLKEFLDIINELPLLLKDLAVLKYHLLRIQNDDLTQFDHDKEYVDKTVQRGFEELFITRKTKMDKRKEVLRLRKIRKQEDKEAKNLSQKQLIVYQTGENLDGKLFGLIVPQTGNFLPEFFEMIRLMASLN